MFVAIGNENSPDWIAIGGIPFVDKYIYERL